MTELAAFQRLHLLGLAGRDGLLTAATVRHLHTRRSAAALGWGVQAFAGREPISAMAGSADTFLCFSMLDPTAGVGVCAVANAAGPAAAWTLPEHAPKRHRSASSPIVSVTTKQRATANHLPRFTGGRDRNRTLRPYDLRNRERFEFEIRERRRIRRIGQPTPEVVIQMNKMFQLVSSCIHSALLSTVGIV